MYKICMHIQSRYFSWDQHVMINNLDVNKVRFIEPYSSPMHDGIIKRKHFLCYRSFVWAIHRSRVNSPHKGQWRGALMFSLICARINGWVNNREACDWRRHRAHYDVIVMEGMCVNVSVVYVAIVVMSAVFIELNCITFFSVLFYPES